MIDQNGLFVFVGGPIQYATDEMGRFHLPTRDIIEAIIGGLSKDGHHVLSAHIHENFGEMDVNGMFREVCLRDHSWMCCCDVFVAILPLDEKGRVIHTVGTSVELGWASTMGKPIILVCDPAPVYSHLVVGLDAVANVTKLDINRPDLVLAVSYAIRAALGSVNVHPDRLDGTSPMPNTSE